MSFIYFCVPTKSFYLILSGMGTRHVLNMDSYNSPPVNSPTGIQSHTTKKTQTYAYKLPAEWMCAWHSYPPRVWVCVSMFFSFIHSMYDGYTTVLRYESVKSKERNTIKTRHRRAVLKPVSRSVFGCFHCCRTAATKYHADFTLWNGQSQLWSVKVESRLQYRVWQKEVWMQQFLCESSTHGSNMSSGIIVNGW